MKLIIMPSRQDQYAPITLSVSRLVLLVGLLLVAALIAGAGLQRIVWKLQPETQPSALVVAAMARPSPSQARQIAGQCSSWQPRWVNYRPLSSGWTDWGNGSQR
jgi:hypothetical protein